MSSQIVRTRYDWNATRPSIAVVETVAAATGRAPTDMRPIYSVVEPEALDALVQPDQGPADGGPVRLDFRYADRGVTVHSDGRILVERI